MGMPIGVDLRDLSAPSEPDGAEAVLDACFDALRRADQTFSLWQPDTPMARLSAGQAGWPRCRWTWSRCSGSAYRQPGDRRAVHGP